MRTSLIDALVGIVVVGLALTVSLGIVATAARLAVGVQRTVEREIDLRHADAP